MPYDLQLGIAGAADMAYGGNAVQQLQNLRQAQAQQEEYQAGKARAEATKGILAQAGSDPVKLKEAANAIMKTGDYETANKLLQIAVAQEKEARLQQQQALMQEALMGGGLGEGGDANKLAALGVMSGNPQLMQLAQFKQAQENRAEDLARGSAETTYKKEQAIFDTEKGLRGEFKDRTKSFMEQRDAFGRIVNSAKDPSGAGDLSLIFNYMKVLDPGSTVREGEFAQVGKAGGLPAEIQGMFNRIQGGERLTPEVRKDLVSRAGELYKGAEEQTNILADEYRGLASQYGAKPERVVGKFGLPDKIKKDYESLIGINNKVVIKHPQYGDVTEDDIATTMQENNMTREQVLQQLGVQ